MPRNVNSITIIIIITLEGTEKLKSKKKMATKQSGEYFFDQRGKKTMTNFEIGSQF